MFCTHCGKEVTSDARFCSQCGQGPAYQPPPSAGGGYYAPRRLFRLTYDKSIGGVCAGFAKYLDLDVTLVRVVVLAVTVFTGCLPGLLAYLAAMIVMPKDDGMRRAAPADAAMPPMAAG